MQTKCLFRLITILKFNDAHIILGEISLDSETTQPHSPESNIQQYLFQLQLLSRQRRRRGKPTDDLLRVFGLLKMDLRLFQEFPSLRHISLVLVLIKACSQHSLHNTVLMADHNTTTMPRE